METIPGELRDIHARLDGQDARLNRMEAGLADNTAKTERIERAVQENTAITSVNTELLGDIRNALIFGRIGTKIFKWLGTVSTAGMALYAIYYAATHGGKPPP